VQGRSALRPTLAMVLGSGFGQVLERVTPELEVPYRQLPGFAAPSVPGHAGRLLVGRLAGVPTILLSGRLHYYEGHSLAKVTLPIRVLAALGVRSVLLTNAAGGIRGSLRPGDFMAIADHINGMGVNPLRTSGAAGGDRFLDLSALYDAWLRGLLRQAARQMGVRLRHGIYLAVAGPCYETPAEIRAFARWGADAVGMSTVPEAIVARQCGLRVAGLSCITNLAAGRSAQPLSHPEVLAAGERSGARAAALLSAFARLYAAADPCTGRQTCCA